MNNELKTGVLSILLADDDKDDRYFFEKALKKISIATKLEMVTDGERLMAHLVNNPDALPDVIFLDLNMPRKNGSECLVEIKKNDSLKQIPVVLCSTSLGNDFASILYMDGAHYYLHKCDFAELAICIEQILKLLAGNPLQPSKDKFMFRLGTS